MNFADLVLVGTYTRPHLLGAIAPLRLCVRPSYFDPSSFRAVPGNEIRFGTTGRNILRGPGFFNLDTSLFRDFNLTESVKLQFRAEMFGATNTPHYGNPGTDPTNPATFGVITSTLNLAGRGTGTGGERQTWFAAKLIF